MLPEEADDIICNEHGALDTFVPKE